MRPTPDNWMDGANAGPVYLLDGNELSLVYSRLTGGCIGPLKGRDAGHPREPAGRIPMAGSGAGQGDHASCLVRCADVNSAGEGYFT